MPAANTAGEQVLEVVVSGPDDANRLLTISGSANVGVSVTGGQQKTEIWTFLVGPAFTRRQFHRALATAALSSQKQNVQTAPASFEIVINSVDADWDDETGRVEVRVEVYSTASASMTASVTQMSYWVAILAQM